MCDVSSLCILQNWFCFSFPLVICSQLSSSRSLALCAYGGTPSSQPVCSYASLTSPLSQTLLLFPFFALQWPSHLPPVALLHCSLLFWGFFPPILFHLPWLFPTPPHPFVIVCQVQDIQWGWPTCVFAAALWVQKGHSGYRSCRLLVTLYAWVMTLSNRSALRTKGKWERDFEGAGSLSTV